MFIQGDSGEKFNVFGGDSIGHCDKKRLSQKHVTNSECVLDELKRSQMDGVTRDLDVHESVHRDTTMKTTNKIHYID